VCCTIRGALVEALERLLRAIDNRRIGAVRRVVIETTGLADPAPIIHLLTRHPYLRLRFVLDGIVTVVDAVNGAATLDTHDEAVKQVAVADRIVVSKSDLAHGDRASLAARLAGLNPGAAVLDAARGEAAASALLACGPFDEGTKSADIRGWLAAEAVAESHQHGHDVNRHDDRIAAFAVFREAAMAPAALEACLERLSLEHGESLLRVKGLVGLTDDTERPAVVHGVQGQFSAPLRLSAWPDPDRRSRLVVIGRDLSQQSVERLLDAFFALPAPDTPDRAAIVDNPLAIAGFTKGRYG
jgi:G3E family GTPase